MQKYHLSSLLNIRLIQKNIMQNQVKLSHKACEEEKAKLINLEKKFQTNNHALTNAKKYLTSNNYLLFADFSKNNHTMKIVLANEIKNQQYILREKLINHEKLLKSSIEKNKDFKIIEKHQKNWLLQELRIKNQKEDYINDEQNTALFKAKINL